MITLFEEPDYKIISLNDNCLSGNFEGKDVIGICAKAKTIFSIQIKAGAPYQFFINGLNPDMSSVLVGPVVIDNEIIIDLSDIISSKVKTFNLFDEIKHVSGWQKIYFKIANQNGTKNYDLYPFDILPVWMEDRFLMPPALVPVPNPDILKKNYADFYVAFQGNTSMNTYNYQFSINEQFIISQSTPAFQWVCHEDENLLFTWFYEVLNPILGYPAGYYTFRGRTYPLDCSRPQAVVTWHALEVGLAGAGEWVYHCSKTRPELLKSWTFEVESTENAVDKDVKLISKYKHNYPSPDNTLAIDIHNHLKTSQIKLNLIFRNAEPDQAAYLKDLVCSDLVKVVSPEIPMQQYGVATAEVITKSITATYGLQKLQNIKVSLLILSTNG